MSGQGGVKLRHTSRYDGQRKKEQRARVDICWTEARPRQGRRWRWPVSLGASLDSRSHARLMNKAGPDRRILSPSIRHLRSRLPLFAFPCRSFSNLYRTRALEGLTLDRF